jgi:hypothetical protein
MIAAPLFRDMLLATKRTGRAWVGLVMMGDDSLRMVSIGPRGGWRFTQ